MHRYDFDGRYAYISPTVEGYVGNIMMILDLADPARRRRSGAGGSPANGRPAAKRIRGTTGCRRAAIIRCALGDRLYVSYWHHGLFILDISDLSRPKLVSHAATSPAFPHPTHTCLPIAQSLKGRRVMVVADEDVAKLRPSPPSFTWIYDITIEQLPVPIATFQVAGLDVDGSPQPPMSGCHQPSERLLAAASFRLHGSRRACGW